MGKLAFSGKGRYTDFSKGYELYSSRCRKSKPVESTIYRNIIKDYCRSLSERLEKDGMVDLPNCIGTLLAASFRRKPQYRGSVFVGFGKMDWKNKTYDGSNIAFGVTFLPSRNFTENLRCFGFVANRRLFQRLKQKYEDGIVDWKPIEINKKMI